MACLEAADSKLTDLSSKSTMENNGWSFDTNKNKESHFKSTCDMHDTWYGFKYPGVGTVSSTFTGSGTAILDYGNCHNIGEVHVYLNGILTDVAYKNTPSKQITFDFFPNDVLLISETNNDAIIKLNSLKLTCKGERFFYA